MVRISDGNDAENELETEALTHDGGAETSQIVGVGEIDISSFFQACLFPIIEERHGETLGIFRGERRVTFPNGGQGAKAPPRGWISGWKMDIGAIILHADFEIFVYVGQNLVFGHKLFVLWIGLGC